MRRTVLVLGVLAGLAASGAASAQWGAGGQGRGHGGHPPPFGSPDSSGPRRQGPPAKPDTPPDQVVITGVVTALGPEPDRVTIAYGAVDALNWPAGSTPFVVTTPKLLDGIAVGQKVRFKIESAHIYALDKVT